MSAHEDHLLPIAAHEVGHALAFRAAGLKVRKLSIERGIFGGLKGGVTRIGDYDSTTMSKRQLKGLLIGMLAGIEAEVRWLRLHCSLSASESRDIAESCASSDFAEFRIHARDTGWTKRSIRADAESLIRSKWTRIEALAPKLAKSGSLSSWK